MNCLILGGNGFIGSHLAKRLKEEGHYVRVVDIKSNDYMRPEEYCDHQVFWDLRNPNTLSMIMTAPNNKRFDEVYQLAADMGGAGYIFTGEHDADIMHNSALINLNIAYEAVKQKVGRIFYSSSACMYPSYRQENIDGTECCREEFAYPADPDSEYGWEKLFSERLYKAFERNYLLEVRIARFHNIFGPKGTFKGDRAKAPSAICRKVSEAANKTSIEIWGDGKATRSFLYIDECIDGILKLMRSDCSEILNIGSDEMITVNNLAKMIIKVSGKELKINNISGPTGVRGRNSHNELIYKKLGWKPSQSLEDGIKQLYKWIQEQSLS